MITEYAQCYVQFLTVPYSSLQFLTVPYSSLQFLTVPYSSLQFLKSPPARVHIQSGSYYYIIC